jgi:hypothetical protein
MNTEDYAEKALASVDEILEDIDLTRARHNDISNSIDILKEAITELRHMRIQVEQLRRLVRIKEKDENDC